MPRCVADIFIIHGLVVNNAVLLCGFKQTKGKRYENSDSFDRRHFDIGNGVTVNHLWPVVSGGGVMKDEALKLALEFIDSVKVHRTQVATRDAIHATIKQALAAPVQDLPFGVGGGLVAIKTLLSRDPCVHANTAIEMIDAILKEHPAAQRQWVGLTHDEYDAICDKHSAMSDFDFLEDIEAKLKEKNT
jgi:hypothetical protein